MAPENSEYRKKLLEVASLDVGVVKANEPLAAHSTWQVGGPADLLVEPATVEQVAVLMRYVADADIPLVVIGRGSNLLFADEGVRGVVLKLGQRLSSFAASSERVIAGAGIYVPWFARMAGRVGVSGFEHTVGIPGTLGGLVLMNGGSQRKSIGHSVVRVWGVTRKGEQICLGRDECGFSYRHSSLQEWGVVATKIELEGKIAEPPSIRQEMLGILRDRRSKFPLKQPNCGSVFLSSPELHATFGPPGRIIEDVGLKGACVGGARVSDKHANFIVNVRNATAGDILALIRRVMTTVWDRCGAELCCEIKYVRANGEIVSADHVVRNSGTVTMAETGAKYLQGG